jgi:N-methylhydantoinase B
MAPGSMVLSLPPSSQSNHVELGAKIARLMVGVVSKALPGHAVADDSGTSGAMIAGGVDDRPGLEGMPFGGAFVFGGGWGGTSESDGISFCQSPLYNCRSIIVEYTEKSMPVVIWEHGVTIDSAGAGRHRGGFGATYAFEALTTAYCTPIVDSSKFPALGLDGGGAGSPSWGAIVHKDASGGIGSWNGLLPAERLTPLFGPFDAQGRPDPIGGTWGQGTLLQTSKPTAYVLNKGEVMRIHTACAGGWGDPTEREIDAVLADVANELVSREQAAEIYGVILAEDGRAVDEAATAAARERIRAARTAVPMAAPQSWPLDQSELEQLRHAPVIGASAPVEA